jgi:hypothetical protein
MLITIAEIFFDENGVYYFEEMKNISLEGIDLM